VKSGSVLQKYGTIFVSNDGHVTRRMHSDCYT